MKEGILLVATIVLSTLVVFGEKPAPDAGKTVEENTQILLKRWAEIAKAINENPENVEDKTEPLWSYLIVCGFTSELGSENPIHLGKMGQEIRAGDLAFGKAYEEYQAKWKDDAIRYPIVKDMFSRYSKAEIFRYQEWLDSYKDELEEFRDDKPEIVKAGVRVVTEIFARLGDWAKPSGKPTAPAGLKCILELARAHAQVSLLELEAGWGRSSRGMRGVWDDSEDSILNIAVDMSRTTKGAATPKVTEALVSLRKKAIEWSKTVKSRDMNDKEYKTKCSEIYNQVIKDITAVIDKLDG